MQIWSNDIGQRYPRYTWDIGLIMLHGAQSEALTDPITGETHYSKYSSIMGSVHSLDRLYLALWSRSDRENGG